MDYRFCKKSIKERISNGVIASSMPSGISDVGSTSILFIDFRCICFCRPPGKVNETVCSFSSLSSPL